LHDAAVDQLQLEVGSSSAFSQLSDQNVFAAPVVNSSSGAPATPPSWYWPTFVQ
jgi:hypothetical protein